MKIKSIYEQLLAIVTQAGIVVRKDQLIKSRGGFCLLNENKLIILHKLLPIETHASILARCIMDLGLTEKVFLTPTVREYIERETNFQQKETTIEFVIDENNKDL